MASIPNSDQIKEAQLASELEITTKTLEQEALGKGFVVPEDGHGPGVIPEDIWQSHKEPSHE